MKKTNLFIAVVVSIFGGISYLSTVSVYAASCPSVFGGFVCSDTQTCTNPGGTCKCNGVDINNGVTCGVAIDPTADGSLSTVANGLVCSDADGCTCGSSTISKGTTCNIVVSDLTAPVLGGGSASVVGSTATVSFTSNEDNVKVSCLGSCGSCSTTASNGSNSVSFTLAAGTYSNCSLVGTDAAGNVGTALSIGSFTIAGSSSGGGGGSSSSSSSSAGGGSPVCSSLNIVCSNGKYVLKTNNYCIGGDLGKSCTTDTTPTATTELVKIIATIPNLTETGFTELLSTVKNTPKYSTVKEYSIQELKIKIYTPNFGLSPIKNAVLSLNGSLTRAIDSKLTKIASPSYLVENYELLGTDVKVAVYKEIGILVKSYNDMLATLYIVLDMKKTEILPLAKYFLKTYLTQFITFKK